MHSISPFLKRIRGNTIQQKEPRGLPHAPFKLLFLFSLFFYTLLIHPMIGLEASDSVTPIPTPTPLNVPGPSALADSALDSFLFLSTDIFSPLRIAVGVSFLNLPRKAVLEEPAAEKTELVALTDEELAEVSAGDFELSDFEMSVNGFDVTLQDNGASMFTMDIAQNAFDSAQGVFTTLQAVNSAVQMSLVVNIYINGHGTEF